MSETKEAIPQAGAPVEDLVDFVLRHTDRGECNCGKCFDRGTDPDPTGHVADVEFFKVGVRAKPARETFERLCREHHGSFCNVNPFDGNEHNYIELGGWLGDQGVALRFMGLGALLGSFKLLTPSTLLPGLPDDLRRQMAGAGYVAVQSVPSAVSSEEK